MEGQPIDIWALVVNGPLAAVCVYLYREIHRLNSDRVDYMQKQVDLMQKAILAAREDDKDA